MYVEYTQAYESFQSKSSEILKTHKMSWSQSDKLEENYCYVISPLIRECKNNFAKIFGNESEMFHILNYIQLGYVLTNLDELSYH